MTKLNFTVLIRGNVSFAKLSMRQNYAHLCVRYHGAVKINPSCGISRNYSYLLQVWYLLCYLALRLSFMSPHPLDSLQFTERPGILRMVLSSSQQHAFMSYHCCSPGRSVSYFFSATSLVSWAMFTFLGNERNPKLAGFLNPKPM